MKPVALQGFLKNPKDVSRTIANAKMELFVGLVNSFQLLTNLKKNSNIGAIREVNAPLQYCNVF